MLMQASSPADPSPVGSARASETLLDSSPHEGLLFLKNSVAGLQRLALPLHLSSLEVKTVVHRPGRHRVEKYLNLM